MKKRLLEVLATVLVGDGVLTLLQPKRHCLLWKIGPEACRELIDEFTAHPTMTRWAGFGQAAVGVWLASQQQPSWRTRYLSR